MEAATAIPRPAGSPSGAHPRAGEEGGASLTGAALAALLARMEAAEAGLTQEQAAERLEKFGPNDPAPVHTATWFTDILRFCANPLVVILLSASVLSALVGQTIDAAIIATIMLFSVLLNFFQTYRSQRAVLRLREQVAPTATVMRDGQWTELPQARGGARRSDPAFRRRPGAGRCAAYLEPATCICRRRRLPASRCRWRKYPAETAIRPRIRWRLRT